MLYLTSEFMETYLYKLLFVKLLKYLAYICGQLFFRNVIFHVIFHSLAFVGFSSQVCEIKMMVNLQCY